MLLGVANQTLYESTKVSYVLVSKVVWFIIKYPKYYLKYMRQKLKNKIFVRELFFHRDVLV